MYRSVRILSSSKMAATSLHVGRFSFRNSTTGASWLANRPLRTSWFLVNSPARRSVSTNEFTLLTARWIFTTISLSKPSIIQHCKFPRVSISLSKTYKWAELGVLDAIGRTKSAWYFFVCPAQAVTCGTVAIIIRVSFLSPYFCIRGVSPSSIHYDQSHRIYINRRQQYISLIWN